MANFNTFLQNKLVIYVSVNKQIMSFQNFRGFTSRLFHGKRDAIFSHLKYVSGGSGLL